MLCSVLHNLCIRQGDILPEYFDNNDDQRRCCRQPSVMHVAGVFKRRQIAHQLLRSDANIA